MPIFPKICSKYTSYNILNPSSIPWTHLTTYGIYLHLLFHLFMAWLSVSIWCFFLTFEPTLACKTELLLLYELNVLNCDMFCILSYCIWLRIHCSWILFFCLFSDFVIMFFTLFYSITLATSAVKSTWRMSSTLIRNVQNDQSSV